MWLGLDPSFCFHFIKEIIMGSCDDNKTKTCQSRSLRVGFALCGLWAMRLEAVCIVALLGVVAWTTPPGVLAFRAGGLSGGARRKVPSSLLLRAAPLFGRLVGFGCE